MTKADIISEITEQTGLQKKEVAVVIESFMETVKRCMLDKKRMSIFAASEVSSSSTVLQRLHVTSARTRPSSLMLTTFRASSLQRPS